MGSLADISVDTLTEEVQIPGSDQSITVRGLGVEDAAFLLRLHGESLNAVYVDKIVGGGDLPPVQEIAQALLTTAPAAVAQIIALANDNPGMIETVRKLSVPVQIDALAKIARLTFHSEAEAKKLVETVIAGSETVTSMLTRLGT